ncbi:MAG: DUF2007 domain-containing protein [Tissierellaceae bacterium]
MTRKEKKTGNQDSLELVLIRRVYDNFELGMITAILSENSIPYILKDMGTGGYMRIIGGQSLYGTEILVEESFFDKASEIVASILEEEQ